MMKMPLPMLPNRVTKARAEKGQMMTPRRRRRPAKPEERFGHPERNSSGQRRGALGSPGRIMGAAAAAAQMRNSQLTCCYPSAR